MSNHFRTASAAVLTLSLAASIVAATSHSASRNGSRQTSQNQPKNGDAVTTLHAAGPFEVKLVPQGTPDKAEGSTLARMSIDKQYHGALEATAKGEMLSAGTEVQGSAGYVAIERVTGTLNGKTGSFVLQHNATLSRGAPSLNIVVVPDSGSGQLVGISGKLNVIIEGGKHSYDFEYTLPPAS
jgi:hypothetical protein